MDSQKRQRWAWALRRGAISAFVLLHLGATVLWVLPNCPLRFRAFGVISWYIQPLGLAQYWGMFAPDPVRDSLTLEAEAIDARGLRHAFAFTRVADFPWWRAVPRYRHSKFAANLAIPDLEDNRILAARHAVRQLDLPPEAFPVSVSLFYRAIVAPMPGGPPADPLAPTQLIPIGYYPIASRTEVSQ